MSIVFAICESVRPGESSVAERACELLEGLELAIPYTTRLPRSADDHGFVFASRDVFERLVASQEFLEYQNVFGNYYGTPRRCLQEAEGNSNDLLIKVDERGVAQIKQKLPDAVSILVLHTSSGRHEHATGSIGGELLRHQLQKASRLFQMQNADKFDHVVANDALEETVNEVAAIIRSERSRRS
jgi:guanylate kinase